MDKEISSRAHRGKRIAACGGVKSTGEGTWTVDSQTKSGTRHRVRLDPGGGSCTCPDYQEIPKQCIHIHAVLASLSPTPQAPMLLPAEAVVPGSGGNDATPRSLRERPTYPQKWSLYNKAQTHEKEMFEVLVRELCERIVQPPQGLGRRRLLLADVVMVVLMKIYTLMSGRRLASAVRELAARGVIEREVSYNSLFRYLNDPQLTPILTEMLERSADPVKPLERQFAVDSTSFGLSVYDHWHEDRGVKAEAEWCKAHVFAGTATHVVVSAVINHGRATKTGDSPQLLGMAASAFRRGFVLDEVAGDKAYLSGVNLHGLAVLGATPYIPFKPNSKPKGCRGSPLWERAHALFTLNQEKFLKRYHRRSNVETTFSMVKAKFGPSVRSREPVAQVNEILAKLIAHNVCCLVTAIFECDLVVDLRGTKEAAK